MTAALPRVIDARARFDARRQLRLIGGAPMLDGKILPPSASDRFHFARGLTDARDGVAPPTFAPGAYRRARILATELLGQTLVEWLPPTPPGERMKILRTITPEPRDVPFLDRLGIALGQRLADFDLAAFS